MEQVIDFVLEVGHNSSLPSLFVDYDFIPIGFIVVFSFALVAASASISISHSFDFGLDLGDLFFSSLWVGVCNLFLGLDLIPSSLNCSFILGIFMSSNLMIDIVCHGLICHGN